MIFAWILFVSLLLYVYYAARIRGELGADTGTAFPAVDAPAPSPPPPTPPADVAEPEELDMSALRRVRTDLPTVQLKPTENGVYRGGAAGPMANVHCRGAFDPDAPAPAGGERRVARRRTQLRREDDRAAPRAREPQVEERRMTQRRVWLRRAEDQEGLDLVDIHEAARMLATTPAEIERWIRTADLPFYMVSVGAVREMRFDRVELMGWLGVEDVVEARRRREKEGS